MTRELLGGGIAGLALLALGAGCGPAPRPSVVLVSIDTLRADHVGAYGAGGAATPTLDALAARGVRFEQAMSPVPLTLPAHATLLTGQLPPHTGVRLNGVHALPAEATSLAERMKEAGHDTGAVVGAVVLAPEYGLSQGFDHYDAPRAGRSAGVGGYLERTAEDVTERALAWLADRDGPFFLWVHYYDPHREFRPPSPYRERFAERPYDGEIAYVDAQLGRLLAAVEAQAGPGGAVVAVTADHGESLGEHGERSHGLTLYDAVLRVPLLVAGPGVPAGVVVEEVVSLADVPATLWRLAAGASWPAGRDLAALWRPERPAAPDTGERSSAGAYAETLLTRHSHGWAPLYSVRVDGERYVRAPRPELYRLADDPGERRDRLASPAASAARARARELDAQIDEVLAGEVAGRERALDPATRAELSALGYVLPERPAEATGRDPKDGLPVLRDAEEAMRLFDRGELAAAARRLEGALAREPDSPALHALAARVAARQGRLADAAGHVERALAGSPGHAGHLSLRGMIGLQRGRAAAAETDFRASLDADPNRAEARAGMLWVALRAGDGAAAEAHAARAAELAGSDWRVHQWLASLWSQAGRFDRALAAADAGRAVDPGRPALAAERAVALVGLGRASEAAAALARAGELAREPTLRNRLAVARARAGDPAGARERLAALVAEHPDFAPARRNLASLDRALAARTP